MLKHGLQQKQIQKLSPLQIQAMKLLQIPVIALEQRIKEELQINPVLEEGRDEDEDDVVSENENDDTEAPAGEETDEKTENKEEEQEEKIKEDDFDITEYIEDDDIPYYKTAVNNTSPDDEHREIPVSSVSSFQETLFAQLGISNLDERQRGIAEQVIGSIDDDGYLRRPLSAIVNDLAFSQNIITDEKETESVLRIIHTFDPAGIGARNLQECLLLQLQRKTSNDATVHTAIKIIQKHMDDFSRKHYEKIAELLQISEDELKKVIHEILRLNPKPGNTIMDTPRSQHHVIPDFIMMNNDGVLELILNSKNVPELRLSRTYLKMLEEYSRNKQKSRQDKEAISFVKQKIESARWFIDALNERNNTLMSTMTVIMNYQYEYFLEGDVTKLKPMILKDIAEKTGLDISTISRVSNSKYVQTPFGTLPLKSFFSESMSTDSGEEVSSREVKKILSDCIEAEDKKNPLTDEKLMKILNLKGYNIARRTIAKYREMLNIPVARMRKGI